MADPEYREALARVVASAFEDDAKVDVVEQLAGQLMMLDAFSLRVLRAAYHRGRYRVGVEGDRPVDPLVVSGQLDAEIEVVIAAFARLSGLGLLTATQLYDLSVNSTLSPVGMVWTETPWGTLAVELCARQLELTDVEPPPTTP